MRFGGRVQEIQGKIVGRGDTGIRWKNMKKTAILAAMVAAALPASGQDKVATREAFVARLESDGSFIALSDGSKFTVELSYRDISKKWTKGMVADYRLSPDGRCPHYEVETRSSQYVCVSPPLSHGGKGIVIQVVQMLTKNAVVTKNSSFAWSMVSLIPSWQRNAGRGLAATGFGISEGTSEAIEVTRIVGMDGVLNEQKVRLNCAHSSCHGLNPNSYTSELKGADIWVTSYGMRWDAKQEKLVQAEYNEHWKIVGPAE
jgi:hypothetical protein